MGKHIIAGDCRPRRREVSNGEQQTGVRDTVYNLSSVLYHAAQGGTVYAKYIEDAEQEGDQELADFFRQVQQQDAERAQKAKALLDNR
jgi:rubrerythrin